MKIPVLNVPEEKSGRKKNQEEFSRGFDEKWFGFFICLDGRSNSSCISALSYSRL
jgi:hypothetical protein